MLDEHVEFLERALVEQQVDALARRQLAAGMLGCDALVAAAEFRAGAAFFKGVEDVFHSIFLPGRATWPTKVIIRAVQMVGYFSPTLNGGSLPGGVLSSAMVSSIATMT